MSVAAIRALYDRHWWANRTLLDATAKLGEAAAAREIGKQFSEPSLARMFFHVYGVDSLWLSRWQGTSPTAIPDEPATLADLGGRWVSLERQQKAFIDALHEPDLDRLVDFRLISGKAYRQPLGLLLHHVADHGTHHRSEIATMLTMVSGSPPETGLARFLFTRSGQEYP
jgi:uncharacterized damage-inducible protein DinB